MSSKVMSPCLLEWGAAAGAACAARRPRNRCAAVLLSKLCSQTGSSRALLKEGQPHRAGGCQLC